MVCKLQKNLYDLKHAPRQQYTKFNNFMTSNGFLRCQADHCCYIKRFDDFYIILLLYVDDMLIVEANIHDIDKLKKKVIKGVCNEGFRCCKTYPWDKDCQGQ